MKLAIIVVLIAFIGSYSLGLLLKNNSPSESLVHKSACELLSGECFIKDNSVEYKILFDGAPSPLTPFFVQLIPLSTQPLDVTVEFEMDGMDMGYNLYHLKNNGEYWSAKVLLPVCSLGRNDWRMRVNYSNELESHLTEFRFVQVLN